MHEFANFNDKFCHENFAIISSKVAVDRNECKTLFKENIGEIFKFNDAILVILSGIHGESDGSLGNLDFDLYEDFTKSVKNLKKKEKVASELANKNAAIEVLNMSDFFTDSKLDDNKLIKSIRNKNPSSLCLGFCFTDVSILNHILRAAGIHLELIMARFYNQIGLARRQKELVDVLQEGLYKTVILSGNCLGFPVDNNILFRILQL